MHTDITQPQRHAAESGAGGAGGAGGVGGAGGAGAPRPQHRTNVKETVTSLVIAFTLAFVFRGFVVEAFLIPTGSMAPTLMGAHLRFRDSRSGNEWPVGPFQMVGKTQQPQPIQNDLKIVNPQTGLESRRSGEAIRWGDRIFVMKYLTSVYDPSRFDVVVFKNPRDPTVNYIKRLLGLPGEQLALIDGDVFVRTTPPGEAPGENLWALPGWSCARKPERAQLAMWQVVFDSRSTPPASTGFRSPWEGASGADWKIDGRMTYAYTGKDATTLNWNEPKNPIQDYYAYNLPSYQQYGPQVHHFPVSDLRMSAGVRPATDSLKARAVIAARGHEFRARVEGARGYLEMRPASPRDTPWTLLGEGPAPALKAGTVVNIDFWHADQALQLWIDGKQVATGAYDWTPEERLRNALGVNLDAVLANPGLVLGTQRYKRAGVRWEFEGGALDLYRVSLERDIHYQAAQYPPTNDSGLPHSRARHPAAGAHPTSTVILNHDQFFTCGDNSPNSLDARLWDAPHPWVAQIDPTTGVVNRDLLIGKAFFVYFPSPLRRWGLPVPDVGRMRWVW